MSRTMHLNLFVFGRGHHEGAWRHRLAATNSLTDFDYYRGLAELAEKGLLDSLFFADILAMGTSGGQPPANHLEPISLLAALSSVTKHIGLIGTASTSYTEPYNLARQFASLDHLSKGRVAWNIVTSWINGAEANFSHDQQPMHADRYAKAFEFMEVVLALWDSWADDAIVDDPASGIYLDPQRIKPIDHKGIHFQVRGPLNVPAPRQRHPVLFQAGSSTQGQQFAARYAEAVFTAQPNLQAAQAFYRSLKEQAENAGRQRSSLKILPGLSAVVASSDSEADQLLQELTELTSVETGLRHLSTRFGGYDFSKLDLDTPLSVDDFPDPDQVQAERSRTEVYIDMVRKQRPTMRQLLRQLSGARGHFALAGSPERIADNMQQWFENEAADGFNLMPPILPALLETFVDEVIPLLQQRSLFRRTYEEQTLRERLGLARPVSRYFSG
ncbi:LLM class flavin-dependent oxidoreductase [Pseudomonas sp. S1Bt23]|uniref:LLM class flavin-dependent oxidoreductase n=1 Tax=Pseudomonas sp. S1Bt23 TaxID=3095074 RepID=UPI002A5AB937|nr:LLM class flavin-dependent oxidoreductase [Pseudomonas sp. S1Bt23]WPO48955.1 LLM class flavin-dependent oxidoreductase [Pseudomonas sp. S1Bt23]